MARIEFPISGMYLGSDHLPGQKRPVLVIGVPGQVVVNAHGAACAIDVFCHDCRLDKSCEYCVVRNIRDRIQEARDARV